MIAIINYGLGNLRSVQKALSKVGQESVITSDESVIKSADRLILPGVGAIKDAMTCLNETGLGELVVSEAKSGKYILGICLGMQLMFTRSFEDGEYSALNLLSGDIIKFCDDMIVPHMGWNTYEPTVSSPLFNGIDKMCAYFVHSYYAPSGLDSTAATTTYGVNFTSIAIKDNLFATQFHPEKSGDDGLRLLKNFGEMR